MHDHEEGCSCGSDFEKALEAIVIGQYEFLIGLETDPNVPKLYRDSATLAKGFSEAFVRTFAMGLQRAYASPDANAVVDLAKALGDAAARCIDLCAQATSHRVRDDKLYLSVQTSLAIEFNNSMLKMMLNAHEDLLEKEHPMSKLMKALGAAAAKKKEDKPNGPLN
jgi:hypothetical protein